MDTILFFSDKGKVYSEKTYQIPDADRAGRGIPIVNVLALAQGETITAAVAVPRFVAAEYCVMATRQGRIKRIALSEFAAVRPSGLNALKLDPGDELGWARLTHGKDEVILVTEAGRALRFSEQKVRPTGRSAGGMAGIRLENGDYVASMEVVEAGADLLVVTAGGFGKRTPLSDYPAKGRGTGGVGTFNRDSIKQTGRIAAARVVQGADDLTIISAGGQVLRTRVKDIPKARRATRGERLIELAAGDSVASLARIADADLRSVGAEPENGGAVKSDSSANGGIGKA
ncbi:MAG TPA: DNA gyrase C-terminal beta-propeller domain-containing protein, partial [Anaerolineales bacterium]|nr:DNA gyrase C-terminal beta-propeller domain-containing protein [Anaerolineales bacterium]